MLLCLLLAASAAAAPPAGLVPVTREQIARAMRTSTGYDPTATTNGGRFQADVLLSLADGAERDKVGKPLFVGHREWFEAFLEVRGLTPERAPLYSRLAHEFHQDLAFEYRSERVVEQVVKGPKLRRALAVRVGWPESTGKPDEYSFEDLFSRPTLQVTNHRRISYRLLAFEDRVVLDTIEGLTGRPNSGALGLLFKVIGEGRVVEYRMAVAPDGLQVSRGRARKAFFEVSSTVTVSPDGRAEKDVPKGRPDLEAIDKRLQEPLEIRYRPLDVTLY
jgi:hypothetical protein